MFVLLKKKGNVPPVFTEVSLIDLQRLLNLDCVWKESSRSLHTSYVEGYVAGSGRKANSIRMHRYLTECPPGLVVDHINGDGLDNKRNNLRVCTQLENMQNITRPGKGRHSSVRGVTFHKHTQKWTGVFYSMGVRHSIGYFNSEEEAISALKKERCKRSGTSEQ